MPEHGPGGDQEPAMHGRPVDVSGELSDLAKAKIVDRTNLFTAVAGAAARELDRHNDQTHAEQGSRVDSARADLEAVHAGKSRRDGATPEMPESPFVTDKDGVILDVPSLRAVGKQDLAKPTEEPGFTGVRNGLTYENGVITDIGVNLPPVPQPEQPVLPRIEGVEYDEKGLITGFKKSPERGDSTQPTPPSMPKSEGAGVPTETADMPAAVTHGPMVGVEGALSGVTRPAEDQPQQASTVVETTSAPEGAPAKKRLRDRLPGRAKRILGLDGKHV